MPQMRMNALKSLAMNCGPLSEMIRGVVPGNLSVVLVDLSVTFPPAVELAGGQAQPTHHAVHRDLRPLRPAVHKVDHLVTGIVRNPASFQNTPSVFFSATCSPISSAGTSFFS
jgi:hypothetical protein